MPERADDDIAVDDPDARLTRSRRRVVLSSFLGSTIEWFDFYIYGLASSLFFAKQFFPEVSPTVGLIASFGTLAGGFIVRPLGGLIGGHYGDRFGRKKVLIASMMVMGASTFLVGVVPTYATIGLWAPVLLVVLRIAQGLGAGAEWGGGVLMVVEHFARSRRGFWGSIGALGVYAGISLSTLVFFLVSLLPGEVQDFAWRIPFIASAVLVMFALWIRISVDESPEFKRPTSSTRIPLVELVRGNSPKVLLGIAIAIGPAIPYQVYVTFGNSYGKLQGFPISTLLAIQLTASLMAIVLAPSFAALSDRIGRRPVILAGCVLICPAAYYFFAALNSGSHPSAFAALILLEIGHSMIYGPQAALFAELFGSGVRYTGASLVYQVAGALSGLAPVASASLLAWGGGPPHVFWVPTLIVGVSAVTLVATLVVPESAHRSLPA